MDTTANPIRAERFLRELKSTLEPARGTYIYDARIRDALEKTSPHDSSGYVAWLQKLFGFLAEQISVSGRKTLDVGCGAGELTVLMKCLGFDATGFDVDAEYIRLARILAAENGFREEMFVCGSGSRLPFPDRSFDIVTMISVVEHLDDASLKRLIPELARVCRGALYVQAPNSASIRDDHTGLLFVPWMPPWLARIYVAGRGPKYRYHISESGSWDVHYRGFDEVIAHFEPYFNCDLSPGPSSYPPTPEDYSPTKIGKRFRISDREVFVGMQLPWRQFRISRGHPREAYYPYLNLILTPKQRTCGEN